ncbi:MAG: hypothetical protein KME09_05660 [Pleurocapsa minor HA4230-MV1]|jgi:hypothetical protein|nr:hypothetical protein [Pleurocapsa minor HA4230-MV1]
MSDNFEINTNEYLHQCDLKDVISFDNQKWLDINQLKVIIYQSFKNSAISPIDKYININYGLRNSSLWFYQGGECEILRAGSPGWQKGKIKIKVTLEFSPDEPEETSSPLDDIRQEIDKSKP